MTSVELRALQAPLKAKYKEQPEAALVTLHAEGTAGDDITFEVETKNGPIKAGLHPATAGSGKEICSGDMLLEALAACAGVTLKSVATVMDIHLRSAKVSADGEIDFRGTLGVSKEALVGFKSIRLHFQLETDAEKEKIDTLIRLTERYCVVFQTLNHSPEISVNIN